MGARLAPRPQVPYGLPWTDRESSPPSFTAAHHGGAGFPLLRYCSQTLHPPARHLGSEPVYVTDRYACAPTSSSLQDFHRFSHSPTFLKTSRSIAGPGEVGGMRLPLQEAIQALGCEVRQACRERGDGPGCGVALNIRGVGEVPISSRSRTDVVGQIGGGGA